MYVKKIVWKIISFFHTNRTKIFFPYFSILENYQILFHTVPNSLGILLRFPPSFKLFSKRNLKQTMKNNACNYTSSCYNKRMFFMKFF